MGTREIFTRNKVVGAWSRPLTSHGQPKLKSDGLHFHPLPMTSVLGIWLITGTTLPFMFCKKECEGVNYEYIWLAQNSDHCQTVVVTIQEDHFFNCLVIIHFSRKIFHHRIQYCTLQVFMTYILWHSRKMIISLMEYIIWNSIFYYILQV
jgi:hypothetical protein